VLLIPTGHLAWQAYEGSFVAYQRPDNPWVYAHTTGDVPQLAADVEMIAQAHADELAIHVQLICPDDDYWPLPWYLRSFTRVGAYRDVPPGPGGLVIITQPSLDAALKHHLYKELPPGQRPLYVPLESVNPDGNYYLRPNLPLRVYVRLDLWESHSRRVGATADPEK